RKYGNSFYASSQYVIGLLLVLRCYKFKLILVIVTISKKHLLHNTICAVKTILSLFGTRRVWAGS
ncbi:hypothetical protein L9F63_005306, partial [Diploptera punctata]